MPLNKILYNVDGVIKIVIYLFLGEANPVREGWISVFVVVDLIIEISSELGLVIHHYVSDPLILIK